jgi:hypothetical protein
MYAAFARQCGRLAPRSNGVPGFEQAERAWLTRNLLARALLRSLVRSKAQQGCAVPESTLRKMIIGHLDDEHRAKR